MNAVAARKIEPSPARSAVEIARELGPAFAARAEAADEDKYVAQNIAELKAAGLVEAGVPQETSVAVVPASTNWQRCCGSLHIPAVQPR